MQFSFLHTLNEQLGRKNASTKRKPKTRNDVSKNGRMIEYATKLNEKDQHVMETNNKDRKMSHDDKQWKERSNVR